MQDPQFGSTCQPFPAIRPEIVIEPSAAERFAFTSALIPGWGVPVAPDAKAWIAWYDLPDWSLTSATWQHVVRAPLQAQGASADVTAAPGLLANFFTQSWGQRGPRDGLHAIISNVMRDSRRPNARAQRRGLRVR